MCHFVSGLFHVHNVFQVYPRCSLYQNFIPFKAKQHPGMDGYNTFRLCSLSVNGHLGCLYLLAIMNSADNEHWCNH